MLFTRKIKSIVANKVWLYSPAHHATANPPVIGCAERMESPVRKSRVMGQKI